MSDAKLNVKFAKYVIEQYSDDLDGLSDGECQDLIYKGFKGGEDEKDIYLRNSQCRALQDALGPGLEGIITKKDRERLSSAGFSPKFIATLAGKDGKAALRHRVKWLGEHYLTYMGADPKVDPKALAKSRKKAFEELASMGRNAKGAMPALIEAAKSDDESIRKMAAETLGKIGPDAAEAVPALISILKNKKGKESRIEAAKALAKIGVAKGAIPALADVFNDKNKMLRLAAIEAFAEICAQPGAEKVRELSIYWLVLISQDDDKDVRQAVKDAFKKLRVSDDTIVKTLMEILVDKESDLRNFAARALGRWGSTAAQAVPVLIDVFKNDDDEWMRIDAAEALAKIATPQAFRALGESGSEEALRAFVLSMQSPDERVRRASAYLVGNIGTKDNISDLIPLMDDPDSDVRNAAVRSVGKLGGKNAHALKLLTKSLDDSDPKVRATALKWIAKMGSFAKRAFTHIEPLLKDEEIEIRTGAIKTLLSINPDRAIKSFKDMDEYAGSAVLPLMRQLDSDSWPVKRAVMITFGNFGGKAIMVVPRMEEILMDKSRESRERALAAATLGRIGIMDASTIAALLVGTADESAKVRKASTNVLRKKGVAKMISPLLEIMEDGGSDMAVRKAATNYLAKFGRKAAPAVPRLIAMLGSNDDETRIMAAYVIASIGTKAKDAQDALIAARDGGSEILKKTATIALKKIGYKEPKEEPKKEPKEEPKKEPGLKTPDFKAPDMGTVTEIKGGEEPAEVVPEKGAVEEEVASVEDLVEAISSGESADRRKAAMELSKKGKGIKKVQSNLINLLKGGDDLARELSAVVLFSSKLNSKKVLKAWAGALADGNKNVSNLAAAALKRDSKKAAPILIAGIKSGEDAGKVAKLKCLSQMGKLAKPALKTMAKFLESDSSALRKAASEAIIKLGKYAAPIIPTIIAKLSSKKVSTRALSAMILWRLGVKSKKAIKALIKRIDDEDKAVRSIAQMALKKIGGDAVPFLIKAYKKGDLGRKIIILSMLGESGADSEEAIVFLLKVMEEGEPIARKVAAGILVKLGRITAEEAQKALESQ